MFDGDSWRNKMDETRKVAARLAIDGLIHIEQRKERLDPQKWDDAGRPGIVRRLCGSDWHEILSRCSVE